MRVLFFNEGNLGKQIMGQGQLEAALRVGLTDAPDVSARFAGLAPMGRLARTATRPLPLLTDVSLDFEALRWHVVQSLRARAALQRELRTWPADVVHVHSHSVAFAMGNAMAELLLRRIEHPDEPTSHVIFPTELIVRESSGPRPQAPAGPRPHAEAMPEGE